MLTIKLCGGLGNQLFQLALGVSFEFDGREVRYDVSSFESDRARRYLLGDLGFNLPLVSENAPITFQEKSLLFDPEVLQLRKGVLNGYWQNERYFNRVARYFRGMIFDKLHLSEKTKEIAKEIAALGTKSCFIHIRRSDNCDAYHKNGPYDGLSEGGPYYDRALEFLQENQPVHFFLFSDDPKWGEENCGIWNPQVTIVNHNAPSFTEDSEHNLRKRPEGREVEDLYLMSLCNNAIIANSTFSWWGAWLYRFGHTLSPWATRAPRVVCAPDPWYAKPDFGETGIIPDRWTRISRTSASSDSEKSVTPSSQS